MTARLRTSAAVAGAALLLFLVLLLLAVRAYPGGSWADAQARGFGPLANYWCDLMRAVAVNGESNAASSALAQTAFIALAIALWFFAPLAAGLSTSPTCARWGVVTARAAALGVVAVAALPYDTRQAPHAVATLASGAAGFVATALLLIGGWRARPAPAPRHVFGAAFVAAALANIAIYVDIVLRAPRDSAALPVVQKIATLAFVLWMAATLRDARPR